MNIGPHRYKTIIGIVIILIIGSLIPILIVENLTTSLPNFISQKLLCVFCDLTTQAANAPQDMGHLASHLDFRLLPFTNYVSGLFYGFFVFSIAITFTIFYVFKPLKWSILLPVQLFLLVLFIYADIINFASIDHTSIGNYLLTTIIITEIVYLVYLITFHLKANYQRYLHKKQYRYYSIVAAIAVIFYIFVNIFKENHPIETHVTFALLILISQFYMHQSRVTKKLHNYILMLFCLIVFYAVCFTQTTLTLDIQSYQKALTGIKILSIPVFVLSLANAFLYIYKSQQNNKKNEMLVSQYVMIVRNYHKLLLQEKTNQEQSPVATATTLRESHQNIEEHLRANYKFTDREIDVIKLVWEGMSNKEIAQHLNISLSTTKYHISNIYLKLNVSSRAQLLILKE